MLWHGRVAVRSSSIRAWALFVLCFFAQVWGYVGSRKVSIKAKGCAFCEERCGCFCKDVEEPKNRIAGMDAA